MVISISSKGFASDLDFRGYLGTLGIVIIAVANLIALKWIYPAALTLAISSFGVLVYGILSKKIGTDSQKHKQQLLVYVILGLAISIALMVAEFLGILHNPQ